MLKRHKYPEDLQDIGKFQKDDFLLETNVLPIDNEPTTYHETISDIYFNK